MTLHSHLPLLPSNSSDTLSEGQSCALSNSPDVVYVQDGEGGYTTFIWKCNSLPGLHPEQLTPQTLHTAPVSDQDGFYPVAFASYLACLHQCINTESPARLHCPVQVSGQYFLFDLVLSPILIPNGRATQAMVLGHCVRPIGAKEAIALADELSNTVAQSPLNRYQELLSDIAWNIRRTLDLDTIWRHTVEGLGNALNAKRCLIYIYQANEPSLTIVGEYQQDSSLPYMGDRILSLANQPTLAEVLSTLRPMLFPLLTLDAEKEQSSVNLETNPSHVSPANHGLSHSPQSIYVDLAHPSLAVATSYQDAPNGLILIWQSPSANPLNADEVNLIQEFADQVGTGIAHASLFAASQDLAVELRQANGRLLQKKHELEEAHQRAKEASRLKSEFLANTSHELRTPLNGMLGLLRLVLDGMADDPEEQQQFISEAYHSAVHQLNLINDILDIAKIEAGRMQIEMSPVNLGELLAEVERFTLTQAEQKSLSYEIFTPPTDDDIILYGNYQRLLQVMLNLVGNAIKFTSEGGITIRAEVENAEEPEVLAALSSASDENIAALSVGGTDLSQSLPPKPPKNHLGHIRISVEDTGIGVPVEKQHKLFQTFSQVESTFARPFGGSGLGLVISKKLIEEMGGTVDFVSMGEGLGSTVTFTVPLFQKPVLPIPPPLPPDPDQDNSTDDKLEMGSINLNQLLKEVERFTRPQAQQKSLEYNLSIFTGNENENNIWVYGNYRRLLQIMLNLVGNAVKFTEEGGVTIAAEIQETDDQDEVKITVEDTGIGMSIEDQYKFFQMVGDVDASLSRTFDGLGQTAEMASAILMAQESVNDMGGTLNFSSMGVETGSTVTFVMLLHNDNPV
ncbi:MAG: GAF domain-containing protein [Cyanothece sp. SIO2G6]|nr:GAF domain-containing protein [Cyanothece sp. SIO2G6]